MNRDQVLHISSQQNLYHVVQISHTICRYSVNTLRPRWNDRDFAVDFYNCIFYGIFWVWDEMVALVQVMAWCQPDNQPLYEPMVVSLCVNRPQWVKRHIKLSHTMTGLHYKGSLPRVRGFWSWFGSVCSLTYCNGNFRVTMVSEPFNVIL